MSKPFGVIYVIKYIGKNGGFAVDETTMYRVEVYGLTTKLLHHFRSKQKVLVEKEANEWARDTGFKIERYKEKVVVTKTLERI